MSFTARFEHNLNVLVDSPPAARAMDRISTERALTSDYDLAGLTKNLVKGVAVSTAVLALSGLGAVISAGLGIKLPHAEAPMTEE